MLLKTIFLVAVLIPLAELAPQNDKALFDDGAEDRRRKKKRRPCRGRTPDGRTFFDWDLQYVDVNYNYNQNYNINCGGGGLIGQPGGGNHKPGGIINNKPGGNKPILSGLFQGGNGPVNFVQSQVQGILSNPPNIGSILPQDGIFNGGGLGSLFQNGLFNGQGISSLFENGLFSGIFDNTRPSNVPSQINRPINNGPSRPPIVTPPIDVQDPDDIIYNDEKPVHEDHDDVVPDQYYRPGQYLVASNPVLGTYVHDFNREFNQKYRKYNREINRFVSLFGF